jgi:CheY-like chemotaxis protein
MVSEILHVEDDDAVRAIVQLSFSGFGFHGETVCAESVADAKAVLEYKAENAETFDLIISDMNLPDGSGLDVVRYVRSTPVWRATPILILSSDVNPKRVGRAYALGANAYVDKSPPGRSLNQVMRSLYEHWGKDAILPPSQPQDRFQNFVAESIHIRTRHAQLYERIASTFPNSPTESAFWMSRALAESNLINLIGFLRDQLEDRALPDEIFDELENMQANTERVLGAAERAFEGGPMNRKEAYRRVIELVSSTDVELLAKSISHLFPVMPMAMDALRYFLISTLEDVSTWIEMHCDDPRLREQANELRTEITTLVRPVVHP